MTAVTEWAKRGQVTADMLRRTNDSKLLLTRWRRAVG
jgi:hypothetical protein